jgi:hypothetical protein
VLFPGVIDRFIQKVNEDLDTPLRAERQRYAGDSVKNLNGVTAEFTTPANTAGLGTDGDLDPSQDVISGIAVLDQSDPEWPNLWIVRVRLRPNMDRLKAAILRLNRECMQRSGGC